MFVKYLESLNSSHTDCKTSKCPFCNKRLFTEKDWEIYLFSQHYQKSFGEKKKKKKDLLGSKFFEYNINYNTFNLNWVGFLGICFEVAGGGGG